MIAVLFARQDSIYKTMPGCDVWDIDRDARLYAGSDPVVAHPPCRAWGKLRGLAKPHPDEKDLARFAVRQVRRCGGVLEHPETSKLWEDMGLPKCGVDEWGGFTLSVDQYWWGHKARKKTWLYIVGCKPSEIPVYPIVIGNPTHTVASGCKNKHIPKRKELSKKAREATPPDFARWLVDLAEKCRK